ncbi:cellulase family glycosylhydrolase [Hymenobacter weizhouensis]|uniref:cellulase family glycosylhydrolase n=1 Tax=Hymenobacter sp. YIM 151500-1 TaxID=2987689 RepID=UPI0022271931|nr:cellulase family glycosylhydrolase [Hymenobacter sp. YIM 151500-1]UYZ63114.1 cellulase family glycosylhydrolase [Hymenobacter sp. YIM 151500-1]
MRLSTTSRFRRCGALAGLLALLLCLTHAAWAQSFLRASGPRIVNASNQEVILNGMNLGGWLVQEGYMMKPGWQGLNGRQTQGTVKQTLYNAGMSEADVEAFYQSYRNNFITKADLDYIAAQGFNCVRLPLHYDLFLTPSQRAVRNGVLRGTTSYEAYVGALTSWYNANQLFTDPANMEALRLIDNVLSWAAANQLYVILDLHAAPGAQGTDLNIADALVPLDFWTRPIYQDITNRLWATIAARYKNDARIAMYDLLNEPNNVPTNQQINSVLQRLINTVRAQGDQHLLLLEGNGWGNDYNYLEKRTFTNTANLVYNSHRYSGATYPLDNNVSSTDPGNANNLRTIGNLTRFRTDNDVPIWVGETGENTDAWMNEAARNLNSVGIGWCHWTYKRFENGNNAAFMHINPPYIVDGPAGLGQVLENIKFANCVPNTTVRAVAPNLNGIVNYPGGGNYYGTGSSGVATFYKNCNYDGAAVALPAGDYTLGQLQSRGILNDDVSSLRVNSGYEVQLFEHDNFQGASLTLTVSNSCLVANALGTGNWNDKASSIRVRARNTAPIGSTIWLRGSNGQYVSSENGTQPITCNRPSVSGWEAFTVVDGGGGKVALRGFNGKYVSSENGERPMTCTRDAVSGWEAFDWLVNADGTISLRGFNGRYVSSENGTQAMTCNRPAISGWEAFSYGVLGAARGAVAGSVAPGSSQRTEVSFYPNPVVSRLVYQLPAGVTAHSLTVLDLAGRAVLRQRADGAGPEHTLDVSGLRNGLYVVRLAGPKFSTTFRISKQ